MMQHPANTSTIDDMLDLIAQTVVGNTERLDQLASTVDQHTGTLNRHTITLDQHTAILNQHTTILNQYSVTLGQHTTLLNQHSAQLDRLTEVALRHEDDIKWLKENVATKNDIRQMDNKLDEILGLVKKNEQEITFMGEWMKRVEKDVNKIKPLVGVV